MYCSPWGCKGVGLGDYTATAMTAVTARGPSAASQLPHQEPEAQRGAAAQGHTAAEGRSHVPLAATPHSASPGATEQCLTARWEAWRPKQRADPRPPSQSDSVPSSLEPAPSTPPTSALSRGSQPRFSPVKAARCWDWGVGAEGTALCRAPCGELTEQM